MKSTLKSLLFWALGVIATLVLDEKFMLAMILSFVWWNHYENVAKKEQ